MQNAPNVQIGWFDKLKSSFQWDTLKQKLNLSPNKLLDIAFFFGIGFLIGFLWKRYAHYFIAAIIFITLLIVLYQLEIIFIQINWSKIQECCGITSVGPHVDFISLLIAWAKVNFLILISFILGFCFGAKVS